MKITPNTPKSLHKYQPYSAYRDSGNKWLKSVPSGWQTDKAKYVFSEAKERSVDGTERLLSVSEYYGVAPRDEHVAEGEYVSRAESLEGYKKCKAGDLAINIMLAWKCGLGVCPLDGIVSPAYSVFRCAQKDCEPWYFHYLLRTSLYTSMFKANSTGIIDSRLRLYPENFGNIPLLIPSYAEQRAIADFLDRETARVDELIAKKQRQIELLQEKRAAVISHAVTKGLNPDAKMKDSGIEWLGEIPEHWSIGAIAWIGRVMNGSTPSNSKPDYWEDGSVPWVSSAEVNQGLIVNPTAYITEQALRECCIRLIPRGSVLIGMVGQGRTRGMCAILGIEACINQNVAAIIPGPKAESSFLQHALTHLYEPIRQYGRGGQQDALNCELVGNIRVPIPPIEEQKAIADFLNREHERIKALSAMITNSMRALAEYRSALISAAVTGKIDVRGEAAA